MSNHLLLRLGDDVKTLQFIPQTLQSLQTLIQDLFSISHFKMHYFDEEGDLVHIAQEKEWQFARNYTEKPGFEVIISPEKGQKENEERKNESFDVNIDEIVRKIQFLLNTKPKKQLKDGLIRNLIRTEVYLRKKIPVPAVHINIKCNGCKDFPLFGARYRCTVCRSFDLCEVCEAKGEHGHGMVKIEMPITVDPEVVVAGEGLRPEMRFVKDVTMGRGTEVLPGTECVKEWMVRNTGQGKWPDDVYITLTSGDFSTPPTPVFPLLPGHQGCIRVPIHVPNRPGTFSGHFRLQHHGDFFGDELTLTLKSAAYRYGSQLTQLLNMGFDDTNHLKDLLERHKGNLEIVISQLF